MLRNTTTRSYDADASQHGVDVNSPGGDRACECVCDGGEPRSWLSSRCRNNINININHFISNNKMKVHTPVRKHTFISPSLLRVLFMISSILWEHGQNTHADYSMCSVGSVCVCDVHWFSTFPPWDPDLILNPSNFTYIYDTKTCSSCPPGSSRPTDPSHLLLDVPSSRGPCVYTVIRSSVFNINLVSTQRLQDIWFFTFSVNGVRCSAGSQIRTRHYCKKRPLSLSPASTDHPCSVSHL